MGEYQNHDVISEVRFAFRGYSWKALDVREVWPIVGFRARPSCRPIISCLVLIHARDCTSCPKEPRMSRSRCRTFPVLSCLSELGFWSNLIYHLLRWFLFSSKSFQSFRTRMRTNFARKSVKKRHDMWNVYRMQHARSISSNQTLSFTDSHSIGAASRLHGLRSSRWIIPFWVGPLTSSQLSLPVMFNVIELSQVLHPVNVLSWVLQKE